MELYHETTKEINYELEIEQKKGEMNKKSKKKDENKSKRIEFVFSRCFSNRRLLFMELYHETTKEINYELDIYIFVKGAEEKQRG
jgi:hypothetical protein